MTTKKPIDLKKQDFKWGDVEDTVVNKNPEQDSELHSLSEMIKTVNQDLQNGALSPVAQDRRQQRVDMKSAVDMLPTGLDELKTVPDNSGANSSRKDLESSFKNALDGVSINSVDSKEGYHVLESVPSSDEDKKDISSTGLTSDVTEISSNKAGATGVESTSSKVGQEEVKTVTKKKKSVEPKSDMDKFKQNIGEMWKPVLGIVILMVAIIVGVSYKDENQNIASQPSPVPPIPNSPSNVKMAPGILPQNVKPAGNVAVAPVLDSPLQIAQASANQGGNVAVVQLAVPEIKTLTKDGIENVDNGSVLTSPGEIDIPITRFAAVGEKVKVSTADTLSIVQILPRNSRVFPGISLGQWPNAVSLRDVPSSIDSITDLFPPHLYQRLNNFQESLVIYDKRSADQEKFVRQSQSCYFLPGEMNGNWLGVNFYMISYCFLNSQFIGFNIYTNNGPDVMKKIESGLSKYSYFNISSVQKMNGFDIINVEQNQAYKILEEYRIQLLNNVISKKEE